MPARPVQTITGGRAFGHALIMSPWHQGLSVKGGEDKHRRKMTDTSGFVLNFVCLLFALVNFPLTLPILLKQFIQQILYKAFFVCQISERLKIAAVCCYRPPSFVVFN